MDLTEILEQRLAGLPTGDYTGGLRAVLQHLRVAAGHLNRGAQGRLSLSYHQAEPNV